MNIQKSLSNALNVHEHYLHLYAYRVVCSPTLIRIVIAWGPTIIRSLSIVRMPLGVGTTREMDQ